MTGKKCPPGETVREHYAHGGSILDELPDDLTTPESMLHSTFPKLDPAYLAAEAGRSLVEVFRSPENRAGLAGAVILPVLISRGRPIPLIPLFILSLIGEQAGIMAYRAARDLGSVGELARRQIDLADTPVPPPPMPEHYDLETFRRRHFDYKPGHHVAFFGPTQLVGKTTTAYQLLDVVATPDMPATTLCMKHQDRVIGHWGERLGFRETPAWPPVKKVSDYWDPPRGYTLWPRQSLTNVSADNLRLQREFYKAIVHNRLHTPSITHANELYGLIAELNKDKDLPSMRELLTAVLTRDSVAGHGLWFETQKPSGTQGVSMPGFVFNSAEHMFLGKDGEERNRRRYGEIGCGISPAAIERETLRLDPFSWLYIRRSGPEWCIVDAYDPALAV